MILVTRSAPFPKIYSIFAFCFQLPFSLSLVLPIGKYSVYHSQIVSWWIVLKGTWSAFSWEMVLDYSEISVNKQELRFQMIKAKPIESFPSTTTYSWDFNQPYQTDILEMRNKTLKSSSPTLSWPPSQRQIIAKPGLELLCCGFKDNTCFTPCLGHRKGFCKSSAHYFQWVQVVTKQNLANS
jgi:hypothetical protein